MAEDTAAAFMDRAAIAAAIPAAVTMAGITTVVIMAGATTAAALIAAAGMEDGTAGIGRIAPTTIPIAGASESDSAGRPMDGAMIQATTIRLIITAIHTHLIYTTRTAIRSHLRQAQPGARAPTGPFPPDNGGISTNSLTRNNFR